MLVFRLIAHTVHQWVPAVTDLLKYVSPLYVSMYLTVEFWDSDLNTSSYLPVLAEIYKPDGNIHPSRSFVPICARGLFLAVQVSQTLLIQGGRRKGTADS